MLTDDDSPTKKVWNVQDLLKYNTPTKPHYPQILKNLEKAKQVDLTKSTTFDTSYESERVSRISFRPKPELESIKTEVSKPMLKKELQPLTHKPRNSEQFAATGQRLAKLEMLCNNQREEIKSKSRLIEKLYSDAVVNKKKHQEEMSFLQEENKRLKEQVESLLKGLIPQGLEKPKEVFENIKEKESVYVELPSPEEIVKKQSSPSPVKKSKLAKEIDFKLLKKRIEDLNDLIDGEQDIVKDKDGAYKFKRRDPLQFIVFLDGIQIEGYPFYKYTDKEAQEILEDVLDCYFPAVLKEKYPEGTPFEIVNHLDIASSEKDKLSPVKKSDAKITCDSPQRSNPLDGGRITNQERIRGLSKPREFSLERVENIVEISTKSYEKEAKENPKSLQDSSATLKIRTESAMKTIILKALTSDSMGIIYHKVKEHSESQNFEIWGGYPPKAYPNTETQCLLDFDIIGESAFHLRSMSTFYTNS